MYGTEILGRHSLYLIDLKYLGMQSNEVHERRKKKKTKKRREEVSTTVLHSMYYSMAE